MVIYMCNYMCTIAAPESVGVELKLHVLKSIEYIYLNLSLEIS